MGRGAMESEPHTVRLCSWDLPIKADLPPDDGVRLSGSHSRVQVPWSSGHRLSSVS